MSSHCYAIVSDSSSRRKIKIIITNLTQILICCIWPTNGTINYWNMFPVKLWLLIMIGPSCFRNRKKCVPEMYPLRRFQISWLSELSSCGCTPLPFDAHDLLIFKSSDNIFRHVVLLITALCGTSFRDLIISRTRYLYVQYYIIK